MDSPQGSPIVLKRATQARQADPNKRATDPGFSLREKTWTEENDWFDNSLTRSPQVLNFVTLLENPNDEADDNTQSMFKKRLKKADSFGDYLFRDTHHSHLADVVIPPPQKKEKILFKQFENNHLEEDLLSLTFCDVSTLFADLLDVPLADQEAKEREFADLLPPKRSRSSFSIFSKQRDKLARSDPIREVKSEPKLDLLRSAPLTEEDKDRSQKRSNRSGSVSGGFARHNSSKKLKTSPEEIGKPWIYYFEKHKTEKPILGPWTYDPAKRYKKKRKNKAGEVREEDTCLAISKTDLILFTLDNYPDINLPNSVILAHSQWMKSTELFDMLVDCFIEGQKPELRTEEKQLTFLWIQKCVFCFILTWAEFSPSDFEKAGMKERKDQFLSLLVTGFFLPSFPSPFQIFETAFGAPPPVIRQTPSFEQQTVKSKIFKALKQRSDEGDFSVESVQAITLFNFDIDVLAHQMTLFDHLQFTAIPFSELLNHNYSDPTKAPSLAKISNHFNQRTTWIATEIYTNEGRGSRILSFYILLAEKLLKFGNIHGFLSILIGLSQNLVSRLDDIWEEVPAPVRAKWSKLLVLGSPMSNFKNLRNFFNECRQPSKVPSSLLFMKDFTMVDEALSDWVIVRKQKLINLEKLRVIGNYLQDLVPSQKRCRMTAIPLVQFFLDHLFSLREEVLENYPRVQKSEPLLHHS